MKLYRLVAPEWSGPALLTNGEGSKKAGGRWNPAGQPTIYASAAEVTAVAERGFYSIIQRVEQAAALRKPRENIPDYIFEDLTEIPFRMATLELSESVTILDLTQQSNLDAILSELKLPNFKVEESRLSPYDLLPHQWTKKIGEHAVRLGYQAIKSKSARSDESENLNIFPDRLGSGDISVTLIQEAKLSAVSNSGKKINRGSQAAADRVLIDKGSDSLVVSVLNFPYRRLP